MSFKHAFEDKRVRCTDCANFVGAESIPYCAEGMWDRLDEWLDDDEQYEAFIARKRFCTEYSST